MDAKGRPDRWEGVAKSLDVEDDARSRQEILKTEMVKTPFLCPLSRFPYHK